jgi:hypothetical protein
MATKTATAAQAGANAQNNTYGNRVVGDWAATGLSATGSAVGLLCKLPHGAKHIRIGWSAVHTGATGAKLQFGIVRNASVTASALVALTDIAVTARTSWAYSPISYSPDWDNYTGGPSFVQVSVGSGTVTAGFVLNYEVTYDAQP